MIERASRRVPAANIDAALYRKAQLAGVTVAEVRAGHARYLERRGRHAEAAEFRAGGPIVVAGATAHPGAVAPVATTRPDVARVARIFGGAR